MTIEKDVELIANQEGLWITFKGESSCTINLLANRENSIVRNALLEWWDKHTDKSSPKNNDNIELDREWLGSFS